jgi:hypothetical protein
LAQRILIIVTGLAFTLSNTALAQDATPPEAPAFDPAGAAEAVPAAVAAPAVATPCESEAAPTRMHNVAVENQQRFVVTDEDGARHMEYADALDSVGRRQEARDLRARTVGAALLQLGGLGLFAAGSLFTSGAADAVESATNAEEKRVAQTMLGVTGGAVIVGGLAALGGWAWFASLRPNEAEASAIAEKFNEREMAAERAKRDNKPPAVAAPQ